MYQCCCGEVTVWAASLTFCKCSQKNSKVLVGDIINFVSIATSKVVCPRLKAVYFIFWLVWWFVALILLVFHLHFSPWGGQNQFSFHAASVEKHLHLRWHHLTVGLKAWLAVFTLQTIDLRQVNNDFHSVWWKNTAFGNERTLAVKNL